MVFLALAWFVVAFAMDTRSKYTTTLKVVFLLLIMAAMVIVDLGRQGVLS